MTPIPSKTEKWASVRKEEVRPLSSALAEVFRIVEDLERCARLINSNDAVIQAALENSNKIQ